MAIKVVATVLPDPTRLDPHSDFQQQIPAAPTTKTLQYRIEQHSHSSLLHDRITINGALLGRQAARQRKQGPAV
jgi:hypothetical protein